MAPSSIVHDDRADTGIAEPRRSENLRPSAPVTPPVVAPSQPSATPAPPTEPAPPPKRSRKRIVISTLLVAALIGGGYEGYQYWTVGRFMITTDDAYVAADVTILAAKAAGYVASVEAVNNQRVGAGDVVARIDDVDYRLAVQAASDKLATQESTIGRIGRQVEAAQAMIPQAQAQLSSAKADAIRTVADLERQTRLAQSDYASKARYEQAIADRDRADAAVKGAEAGIVAAQANVAVLEAQKSEAGRLAAEYRTAVAKAERDLSFTLVKAPVAGVLGNRAVELGNYVQPGTRLAALVPLDSVRVDANFKETQVGRIRPGQSASVEVDAYPGREFHGTVESVAPASGAQFSLLPPENATGNFTKIVQRLPVRIKIDRDVAAEGLLRPGMSVVARIDWRTGPGAGEAETR